MSWIRIFIFQLIFFLILMELSSIILTKLNLFIVNDTPKLYSSHKISIFDVNKGRTERESWGVWRKSNYTARQVSPCYNVEIVSNEIGARDKSFKTIEKNSIFLLGDSFAEGWGVNYTDTSQYLIEKNTSKNILNFGSGGNFGPLQKFLIYKHFKNDFDHDGIIIYVLPANDFTDNDLMFWNKPHNKFRFRPYYSLDANPMIPFYFQESEKRDSFVTKSDKKIKMSNFKGFIVDNFWTSNVLRTIKILNESKINTVSGFKSFAGYYDNEQRLFKNFIVAYEEIARISDNREILFVIIPDINDIRRHKYSETPKLYKKHEWYISLTNLNQKYRTYIVDLLEFIPEDYSSLFHSCDGHWSIKGNQWSAEIISNFINDNNIFLRDGAAEKN